jgi:hypothetical protein
VKWPETQPNHEGAGDGDGRAESGSAFDECAKAECHQQHLQAPVGGDAGNRFLHDFELAGCHRNVVEKDSRQHDPGQSSATQTPPRIQTRYRQNRRHLEKYDRHEYSSHCARDGTPVWLDLQSNQQSKQHKMESRNQRGKPPASKRVVDLGPVHDPLPFR